MGRSFDHFNVIARWYDRFASGADDTPLATIVAAQPSERILDLGGGTGRSACMIADSGAGVVVCDSSSEMLRQARAKRLLVVRADARHLPFADNCFDRAMAVDAFHHFATPNAGAAQPLAAAEMVRVTRGNIVVQEPDIRKRGARVVAVIETLLLMRSRFLRPEDLGRLFSDAGAQLTLQREDHFNFWLVFRKGQQDQVRGAAFPAVTAAETAHRRTGAG